MTLSTRKNKSSKWGFDSQDSEVVINWRTPSPIDTSPDKSIDTSPDKSIDKIINNDYKYKNSFGLLLVSDTTNTTNTTKSILLVKGRESGKWGPPKGHMNQNEKSTLDTAIRETFEETGIKIEKSEYFKRIQAKKTQLYVVNVDANLLNINIQDVSEISDCKWFNVSDLIYERSHFQTKFKNTFNSPMSKVLDYFQSIES